MFRKYRQSQSGHATIFVPEDARQQQCTVIARRNSGMKYVLFCIILQYIAKFALHIKMHGLWLIITIVIIIAPFLVLLEKQSSEATQCNCRACQGQNPGPGSLSMSPSCLSGCHCQGCLCLCSWETGVRNQRIQPMHSRAGCGHLNWHFHWQTKYSAFCFLRNNQQI